MNLRPYQEKAKQDVYDVWQSGKKNALFVLATGGGKTRVLANIVHEHVGGACVIAHRQELVSQISLALAREGVRHKIIGPSNVVKLCVKQHMEETGQSWYTPSSQVAVAGVDTLVRRTEELKRWLPSVTLWVTDEAHHITQGTKWHTACEMFPNAKGLGVTATPLRADGKGLGRHADGVFDEMVLGPSMAHLIRDDYLTKYRIFAPPSDLDLTAVKIGSTGDFSAPALAQATRKSHVMGDVVSHYLRIAKGKLGITFATDVQSAKEIAEQFIAAGVPAIALDAKTPDADRISALRRFKRREILQLVNVDLFGEGFDLPAIEVCSMARATQSYGLYVQIFGRALRLMEGKEHAIIIDHVGNVVRHGLPDAPRTWTLDRRDKRESSKSDDVIPVKACPECTQVYERVYAACPYCGFKPIPAIRSGPEQVDGDLHEMDEATLSALRGGIESIDRPIEDIRAECHAKHIPQIGHGPHIKRHMASQKAQVALRETIAWWAGYRRAEGMADSESYRRFYFKFGVDVLTAQGLGEKEALALNERITLDISFNT